LGLSKLTLGLSFLDLAYRLVFQAPRRHRAAAKMGSTGDTKAGTLIAVDRYGNKYYENLEEELPRESQRDMIRLRKRAR
jgi:hypothetical protein